MTKSIPLTKGKFALIDDEDYDWLMQWKWVYSNGYAFRWSKGGKKYRKGTFMHRMICNTSVGMLTDHINGNKLDNRRSNLRICTASDNQANRIKLHKTSSSFKGVSFNDGN